MQRSKHYRGVNKEVWQQLYNTYGGGPVLRRTEVNIYAEEPQERDSDSKNDKKFQSKYCLDGENDDDSNPMVSNEFEGSQSQVQSLMMGKGKNSFSNRKRPSDTSSDKQLKRYMTGPAVRNSGKGSSNSRPKSNLFMPKRMKMVRIATLATYKNIWILKFHKSSNNRTLKSIFRLHKLSDCFLSCHSNLCRALKVEKNPCLQA